MSNLERLIENTIIAFPFREWGVDPLDADSTWPAELASEIAKAIFMTQLRLPQKEIPKEELIVQSEYVGADAKGDGGEWTVKMTHQPTGKTGIGYGRNSVRASAAALAVLREKVFGE